MSKRTWVTPILYVQSVNWILQAAFMRESLSMLLLVTLCLTCAAAENYPSLPLHRP